MSLYVAAVGPSIPPDLHEQTEQIITEARRQGASACEVAVSLEQDLSTNVRQGEVETVEFSRDQGFGITLYAGQHKGSASTSATGEVAIRETVAAALVIARHTSEDEYAGLADAALMARELPKLDLYHPQSLSPEQVVERVLVCEAAAFAADKRVAKVDGTTLNTHQGCRVYGNSHGFIGGYASTRHSLSCVMTVEGEGQMQCDHWYDANRHGEVSASAELIGRRVAERAAGRLGAWPMQTAEASVLFAPKAVVGPFGHFLGVISGDSLYRKLSFLEGALDQRLFSKWLSIDERPHPVGALGSASFDSDSLVTYAKPLVGNGKLVSYVLGIYSGRKPGLPSTASAGGMHNLFVSHGDRDQAALVRRVGCGLLVIELMGQSVSLVTDDYSCGIASHWVESGEIQFPVQEVTIATNLYGLFRHIAAVGKDIEWRDNLHTGSVLVESTTITGR